jgi:hypothetical protein
MKRQILLGLFLNFVLGLATAFFFILVLMVLAVTLFIFFDIDSEIVWLLIDIATLALTSLLPFWVLNRWMSKRISREIINLYYDKRQMVFVQILYWVGAALLFYLPVLLLATMH